MILADLPLAIDPDEVLRFQGYKRGIDVPGPDVRALFDEALALGRRLITPRAALRWVTLDGQDDGSLRAEGVTLTIPDIRRHWGAVRQLAVAIVTIGDALERRVAELWDARELPLAAMLDSVGSGAVESLAEYVNDLLCQEGIARGVKVTNRISPGYGAWDVAEQALLFRLCPGAPVGVQLNEACFMTPQKSISLLVGAGPHARVDHYFSQCARCWMADCAYRRVPARRTVHRT
ncbi:MAG TPA: vitamin B12 dependent-methionine synthase activation domain-containing protein [Methylomirabilota bacterium]